MFNINTQKTQKVTTPNRGVGFGSYLPLSILGHAFGRYPKVNARGTLTLSVQPSNNETFTIGSRTYTLQTTLTNTDGNIKIGGTLAETQANIVAAINLTGNPGTQYALATRVNTQVSIGNFVANIAVVKAKEAGTSGNSIVTTETFASGSNVFDGATLGTYLAGNDYSYPDLSYRPVDTYFDASGDQPGERTTTDYNIHYHNYGQYQSPNNKWKWNPLAFHKVHIPNHFGARIKSVPTLGFSLLSQWAKDISTVTGHASNDVRKIIEVGTNKGVAMFVNGTDSKIYVVAFTVNTTTGEITPGTPVQVSNSTANGDDVNDIVAIGTDKFIVGFQDSTATNFPKCAVGTISGTTITMAGGVQPVATATTIIRLIQLSTDKALLMFNADSMYVVTIAVTTPSYGPLSTLTSATGITACQNGTDKFQLAYTLSSANYTMACTVSGSTITQGTALRVTAGNAAAGAFRRHKLVQVATDKIVYITDTVENLYGVSDSAYYMTVSGTVTTVKSATYKGISEDSDVDAILLSANRIMFVQNYTHVGFIDVDQTNELLYVDMSQANSSNHMMTGNNNFGNAYAYIGTGSARFGKVGSFVFGISKQPDFNNKLGYYAFPISTNVDIYKDDEYLKTVEFKYPLCYYPIPVNLDINDYEVNIKFKNPNNQMMYILPQTNGYQNLMILE